MMYPQLSFDFDETAYPRFDKLLGNANAELIYILQQEHDQFLYLWGEQGSGKSHILQAWVGQAAHAGHSALYIDVGKTPLHDTAAELLALYAKREATAGITIAHDPAAQAALAAEFPFATTPDQQTAIDAVLADLARPQPMDRIICGDVGFGKTEVAVRAIHAAASAGYQVALIAPTTLLAEQHYHNLQDRFATHPLTIDSLSRFKSAADAKRARRRCSAPSSCRRYDGVSSRKSHRCARSCAASAWASRCVAASTMLTSWPSSSRKQSRPRTAS